MRPEIAHAWTTSDRACVNVDGLSVEERFAMLNKAFSQRPVCEFCHTDILHVFWKRSA